MAPNLETYQLELIQHMIQSRLLTTFQMAHTAGYSKQSIIRIESSLHVFGNARAPRNGPGRFEATTQPMLDALFELFFAESHYIKREWLCSSTYRKLLASKFLGPFDRKNFISADVVCTIVCKFHWPP